MCSSTENSNAAIESLQHDRIATFHGLRLHCQPVTVAAATMYVAAALSPLKQSDMRC